MAPLPPDPYKILGVSKEAKTNEIRASHRKLVLQCHPDKVQDPKLKEEKQAEFQRVQQAYELLTNDAERQKYDDKVRLEDLRRQMKEKANISTPKPSAKYSSEFEIRTPDMRSSAFKSSPSSAKVYTFGRYDDEYASRGTRIFETKSNRSAKREPSFAERHSKRESEKEREKEKERDRERRRKEEKKRQEKQRDRDIKRDAEEKYRSRNAKPSVEVFEEELPKSERKRSSKKHDDKAGRTSPRDEKPMPSSRAPPVSSTFYSSTDRNTYETASSYVQASRANGLNRSYSYSSRPVYPPAAPSPPPSNVKKAAYATEDSDSDDYVRRSSAPSRRGSGDGPRISRERSAYRQPSHEVLEDNIHVASSPAARHTASFSRSVPMGSSPPRHEMQLPRVNSMPQPSFTRPSPGITRAHTFASDMPRGRDRSRNQPQAPLESESEEEYERERERRYRSRRTASPEHMPSVFRYEVDSARRTHRMPPQMPVDVDPGHGHYMYAQPVREARAPPTYRESSHAVPSGGRYPSVKTTRYGDVRYSEYPPYGPAVRA